jgi:hypothetical protein
MWRQKLKLEEGETLRLDKKYASGHLGQKEVELYSVIDQDGKVVGAVEFTDHTNIKAPFKQTFHLVQRKADVTLVDERWSE